MNQETKFTENGLIEQSKEDYIIAKFKTFTEIAEEWSNKAKQIVVTDESQTELMQQAKEGRLILKSKRIEIEKTRKSLKEQSLNEGRLIDSVAKQLSEIITPAEKHLELQEKFIEIKEQERVLELTKERTSLILPYSEFIDLANMQLGSMTDISFNSLLKFAKQEQQNKIESDAKIKAEKEAKDKADAEERERVRLENIKLKEEAKQRQEELEKEKAKTVALEKEKELTVIENKELKQQIEEVKTSPAIIAEIEVIDAKVEDVCPTHDVEESVCLPPDLEYDVEDLIALKKENDRLLSVVERLQYQKAVLYRVVNNGLLFIIPDNLRKQIENALELIEK